MSRFASAIIAWQRRHGRKNLPWQDTRDPYRIWLSEVMLQQTQVAAVIPYYERFLRRFPTLRALARAEQNDVLRLWSGLGYYARGRNLHLASKQIVSEYKGRFPHTAEKIAELPGIGRSTAAAIAAFAFGERAAILDGNVKRVLARCFALEGEKELWSLAERLLPKRDIEAYTQALMDIGATVCTRGRPRCDACPVASQCIAKNEQRIAELPAPRARKPLPVRKATWIVLLHGRRILLERRPGAGIWGGLLVFPEMAFPETSAIDIRGHCRRALGCEIGSMRELALLEHGFTHFRLRAVPVLCQVRKIEPRLQAPQRQWVDLSRAAQSAVPAPVRILLGSLRAAS